MAKQYILSKNFTPYGLLFESGKIVYFNEKAKEEIGEIKENIYHIEHRSNGNISDSLRSGKKEHLPDLIMSLQISGFMVEPVTSEFVQNIQEELSKL